MGLIRCLWRILETNYVCCKFKMLVIDWTHRKTHQIILQNCLWWFCVLICYSCISIKFQKYKVYYMSKSWMVPFSSKQFFFNFFKSPNKWLARLCHAPFFGQYFKIFWSKNLIKFRLQKSSKFSMRMELLWFDLRWSKKILNFLKFSNSSSIRWNSSASTSASPSL